MRCPQIKAKARAMGKEALQKRLAEIQMTKSEDNVYQKYYDDVTSQISILKEMLKGDRDRAPGEGVCGRGGTAEGVCPPSLQSGGRGGRGGTFTSALTGGACRCW